MISKTVLPIKMFWMLLGISVIAFLCGLVTLLKKKETSSEKEPVLSIITRCAGCNTQATDALVTLPVEIAVKEISGTAGTSSFSSNEMSVVHLFASDSKNGHEIVERCNEALASLQLPGNVTKPTIIRRNYNEERIIRYTLQSNRYSATQLLAVQQKLAHTFSSMAEVEQVKSVGGAENALTISVDATKMEMLNVDFNDIAYVLGRADGRFLLSTLPKSFLPGRPEMQRDYSVDSLVIKELGRKTVFLKNIAQIQKEEIAAENTVTRNGTNAVEGLIVFKQDVTKKRMRDVFEEKRTALFREEMAQGLEVKEFYTSPPMPSATFQNKKIFLIAAFFFLTLAFLILFNSWSKTLRRFTALTSLILSASFFTVFFTNTSEHPGSFCVRAYLPLNILAEERELFSRKVIQLILPVKGVNSVVSETWAADYGNAVEEGAVSFFVDTEEGADIKNCLNEINEKCKTLPGAVFVFPENISDGWPKSAAIRIDGKLEEFSAIYPGIMKNLRSIPGLSGLHCDMQMKENILVEVGSHHPINRTELNNMLSLSMKGKKWAVVNQDVSFIFLKPLATRSESVDQLKKLKVRNMNKDGELEPLSNFAKIKIEAEYSALCRNNGSHVCRLRFLLEDENSRRALQSLMQNSGGVKIPAGCRIELEE